MDNFSVSKYNHGNFFYLYLLLALLFFSSCFSLLFVPEADETISRSESKDYLSQFLNFPLYFFVTWLTIQNRKKILITFFRNPLLIFLFILPLLSVLWSLEPINTFIRSCFVMLTTLLAINLHLSVSRKEFFNFISFFFTVAGIVTLLAVLVSFQTAIHQDSHYPALRGFFQHKNPAGRFFVLGLAFSLFSYITYKNKIALLSVIISSLIVILTLSGTAFVLMFLVYVVFFGLATIRTNKNLCVTIFILCFIFIPTTVLYLIYSGSYVEIFAMLDKDPTLTGRTVIWETLIHDVIPDAPYIGYGYEGFWLSLDGAFNTEWDMYFYIPPHAHNVILQTLVNFGFFGLFVLLYFICKYVYSASTRFIATGDQYSMLCVSLSIYILVVNFSEVVLWQNSVIWFLILYTYLGMCQRKV